jgi:cytochrome P450
MYIAEPDLIQEVYTRKNEFIKPIDLYDAINVYGPNIVSTNGWEWKRHRKITAPYFGESSNQIVFKCAGEIVNEMLLDWEESGLDEPKDFSNAMYEIALTVISGVAFGKKLPWKESQEFTESPSFKVIVSKMVNSWLVYAALPKSLYLLPIRQLREIKSNMDNFERYLNELINVYKQNPVENENNILNSLITSIDDKSSDHTLTLREAIGDMFIFMFAGHETTAGTLSFAFTLLALHQDIQDRLYDEIVEVTNIGSFEYEDLQSMPFALAVLNETLRLHSPVAVITKKSNNDYQLGSYFVPSYVLAAVHVFGAQYSEKYWGKDRFDFKPSRWFIDEECAKSAKLTNQKSKESTLKSFLHTHRYAFSPFSDGPRSCLGKRFAEVEAMTVLIKIIKDYKIVVPDGTTKEMLLDASLKITYKQNNPTKLILQRRIRESDTIIV